MLRRYVDESIAALFLGDAVICLLWPRQHMHLWRDVLPLRAWRNGVGWFEARPTATRLAGLLQGVFALRSLKRLYRL